MKNGQRVDYHSKILSEMKAESKFIGDLMNREHDPVNHPSHYTQGKFEVIEVIEDWKMPYHLGNAIKYIARAGKKDPEKALQDLQKAVWYLERHIKINQDVEIMPFGSNGRVCDPCE